MKKPRYVAKKVFSDGGYFIWYSYTWISIGTVPRRLHRHLEMKGPDCAVAAFKSMASARLVARHLNGRRKPR